MPKKSNIAGVRFGSPSFLPGFGAELSYQHGLGTTNFI